MYKIDTMYDASMEAFFHALDEGKVERWMACIAWWNYRQHIGNAQEYWGAVAGKLTADLPTGDCEAVLDQLSKVEDALVGVATDWPERPENLLAYMAGWDPQITEPDIEVLRTDAVRRIDRGAEDYRLKFITNGSGQVMTYQQKLAEARAKLANASIPNAEIPHIVTEAEIDGMTLLEKAGQIVGTYEAWQGISALIEGKRMAAKKAVADATDAAAVKQAAIVNWGE